MDGEVSPCVAHAFPLETVSALHFAVTGLPVRVPQPIAERKLGPGLG